MSYAPEMTLPGSANWKENRKFAGAWYIRDQNHDSPGETHIRCRWEPFRAQILLQWNRLSAREVDEAGPDRNKLAVLIQNKYGVAYELVENYLRNFERTLPLM